MKHLKLWRREVINSNHSMNGGSKLNHGKVNCLRYTNSDVIMPQYAIQRLYELTKKKDTYITTEVGQHQMWAQFYKFDKPNDG